MNITSADHRGGLGRRRSEFDERFLRVLHSERGASFPCLFQGSASPAVHAALTDEVWQRSDLDLLAGPPQDSAGAVLVDPSAAPSFGREIEIVPTVRTRAARGKAKARRSGTVFVATDLAGDTDSSELTDALILEGHERARAEKRPLTVCHVIRNALRADPLLPGLREGFVDGLPVLREVALQKVRACVAQCTGRVESEYEALIEDGSPAARIVDAAEARAASLIVVGAHPPERHNHRLIGSVTERVVRHAHGPVLVLRPGPRDGPVLVATDFSDPAAPAIAAAAGEARRRRVPLALLHSLEIAIAGESPREDLPAGSAVGLPLDVFLELRDAAKARLQKIHDEIELEGEVLVDVGPASTAILQAAEAWGASLVVVGTKGRTGWSRVLLGSVAESVVHAAPCSVLVVRLHHRPAPALRSLYGRIRHRA